MNRIVLVGNGFDLAHGLKTSYKDFYEHLLTKDKKYSDWKIIEKLKNEKNIYWYDFEKAYYDLLLVCVDYQKNYKEDSAIKPYIDIVQLNQELNDLKEMLKEYLLADFKSKIEDITLNKGSVISDEIEKAFREDEFITNKKSFEADIKGQKPKEILFLDFNYTYTTDKWYQKNNKIIHIHGTLLDDQSPMIFGYGDDNDDRYKEIEKLDDNRYLQNIKSINYWKNKNYKEYLNFINNKGYYQVYVMGHSCGLTDKTLLKELFEHPNCVSIKPYYYFTNKNNKRNKAGYPILESTDYTDIVNNISRLFDSKTVARDKVVPFDLCSYLPQLHE